MLIQNTDLTHLTLPIMYFYTELFSLEKTRFKLKNMC